MNLNAFKVTDQLWDIKFMSKGDLAKKLGISPETLRMKLKEIEGLNTGRRKLLYPWEVKVVRKHFIEL